MNQSNSNNMNNDSRFSRLGSQSLVIPQIDDKRVYERQAKNYNIINIQPKEYHDTIKQFPKYRLENQDGNFYKKVQLENEYRQRYVDQMREREDQKWNEIRRLEQ